MVGMEKRFFAFDSGQNINCSFFSVFQIYWVTGNQRKPDNLPILEVKRVLFIPTDDVRCRNKYFQKIPMAKLPRCVFKNYPLLLF
jgi:hypothetical protein